MGADLAFQVEQFRFGSAQFRLIAGALVVMPAHRKAHGHCSTPSESKGEHVANEQNDSDPRQKASFFSSRMRVGQGRMQAYIVQQVKVQHCFDSARKHHKRHQVAQHKKAKTASPEVDGDEPKVVEIERQEQSQRKESTHSQSLHIDVVLWLCEEGGRENVAPHHNVEYDFYQLTTTETFAHCKGAMELRREYAS